MMFDSNGNNLYGGYQYNPQTMPTKQGSTLSQEENQKLLRKENQFSLALTEIEMLKGICNHRTQDGTGDTLIQCPDGSVRCSVCGYEFMPVDSQTGREEIQEATKLIVDILQTIKLLYIDMPIATQREFFQIIPLIEKVPQLFELAVKNFSKHENFGNWGFKGQNMSAMNLFSMLSGALSDPNVMMGGAPQMGMPMGGMPQYGNPAMNPQMGMPMGGMPMSNGFGFVGNPQMTVPTGGMPGYNPQTSGWQYNPNQAQAQQGQPPVVPEGTQAPTQTTATTDGKTVTANAQFKA